MLKKIITTIVIWISIILFIELILFPSPKLISFESLDFPETISVKSNMDSHLDKISMVLAYEVFQWDTLDLFVYYLPDHSKENDPGLLGSVQILPFGKYKYFIFIDDNLTLDQKLLVLCHEFIHISQLRSNRLKVNGNEFTWEGRLGYFNKSKYLDRPFELEAYLNQFYIKEELEKFIYK